ncbi:NAD/NADP octopine/nopaline dehydrogenase family protein [Granulicoccus sp. GXG6511]|uniref:NAD/NADP octopine/nopaline dehydrogenase family protein n=1 Tax=Granulicoccus sp. GXG6511 TaxID=3381351 RepID=UPI003D7CBDAC
MKVAVLGSGNGGLACAFELAMKGREVALFDLPEFGAQIAAVAAAGGITSTGALEGFAPVSASHDIAATLAGADLVMVVGPAFATPPMAEVCRDHLQPGMAVLVCPSSCAGALTFRQFAGLGPDSGVIVGETSTLPYAVRISGPAQINIFHRLDRATYLAATPQTDTDALFAMVEDVWPLEKADSVLQTTLQNGNPVIHPAVSLLNAGPIDRGGDFLFYEEGVTEGVGRLIEAVDRERLAIAAALEVPVLSEPALGVRQGYMSLENYSTGYSTAPGFLGIGAQGQLDHRYLTEDVGYGLVFLTDLAVRLGVPTPVMDAVIQITDVVLGRDFRAEQARTLESLGLGDLSAAELRAL